MKNKQSDITAISPAPPQTYSARPSQRAFGPPARSIAPVQRIKRAAGLCLLALGMAVLSGCSLFEKKPDEAIFIQRLESLVNIGWDSVRIANPKVVWTEKTRFGYQVAFAYQVVFTQNENQISPEEVERIRHFLPSCVDVPIQANNQCAVEETLLFVETDNFGWMPENVVRFSPHLLPILAQEGQAAQ